MQKYKYTSDEGELFLNKLAVYGTSLAKGSIQQQVGELERIIKNFSDINYRDRNGMTFLSIAVQQRKLDVIKILLENGANPNIEDNLGIPPLSYVFLKQTPNTEDIIKLLLNYVQIQSLVKLSNNPLFTLLKWHKLRNNKSSF